MKIYQHNTVKHSLDLCVHSYHIYCKFCEGTSYICIGEVYLSCKASTSASHCVQLRLPALFVR